MKIQKMLDSYETATDKVSELVRQLSFAGIAVVWIFRIGKDESAGIPFTSDLLIPLIFFVMALCADFIQYIYKSIIWGFFNNYFFNKYQDNQKEVDVPRCVNWPTIVMFWLKVGLLSYGYIKLLYYIALKLI